MRPLYLAMRVYQRARIARARLTLRRHRWRGVRILGYHRIADEPGPLSVRPDAFRRQIEACLAAGMRPIRLDAALDALRAPPGERLFCVTFDDGYRDNLEHAVPVLREHGVPATIFVVSRIVDGEAAYWWFREPPPALTWDEIRDLVAEGLVDVQAHTRTHPRLPHVDDATARDEIAGCKTDIEARVGYELTSFGYPAGLYGERDVRLVREAGYRAGVTTDPGVNNAATDLARLKRTMVYWEDGDDVFELKIGGALDREPLLRRWLYRRLAA